MKRSRIALVAAALGLCLVATACGGTKGGGGSASATTLSIVNASGSLWTCNYNPFAPVRVDVNLIYEPLYVINDLTGEEKPWLATEYQWGNGNKQLTLTIRKDVRWTDDKPLTAKDVAFTFNQMKQFPAIDESALWSDGLLKSVTAQGEDKVVIDFNRVSTTSLRYVISTRIKPEHIWASVKDPVKQKMTEAVGTGPYKVDKCSPQSITYVKNANYWQKGLPVVEKVLYPAFTDNQPANRYLAQGKGDWGGQFVPNIETYWVKQDPEHRKFWYPAVSNVAIGVNVTKPYLKDKLVRQGLSYVIDRDKVSEKGMYGYQKPASQTGIVDTFKEWRDEAADAKYGYKYDCAKAAAKFTQAGFKKGADGMFTTPDGKPFKPELINNGGFTDWVASVQVIEQGAKKCGVGLQVANLNGPQYDSRRLKGQFDLAYGNQGSGPAPYFELRNWLFSKLTEPVGTDTETNFERWQDDKTDQLIREYDTTLDKAKQKDIVNGLQQIMLEEVPFIPVTQNVSWSQTDTSRFTGWPTEKDPYANPAPYAINWEVVLLRLKPVEK